MARVSHTCPVCHKIFFDCVSNHRVYCSKKCVHQSQSKKVMSLCPICHKTFFGKPSDHRVYCSNKCYGDSKKGTHISEETKKKMRINAGNLGKKGSAHPGWHGDNVKYGTQHSRVRIARGKAIKCEVCGATKPDMYHWANLSGEYGNIEDYAQMCVKCHKKYDKEEK